ncbi:rhomboid family intramembrane serine protease [Nereida sp. MMG025]|uniref:rhomboid family intramembrane serine protease n=1 Tax=Nereida sp. MMG025 TaxID=2909981 RepID=UPI001F0323C4|nr:rhomboid family intramembrane serine protease [Nereida sp. MMG025]MCF6445535.1 rhomboid family intramembrane serine protease [Nereida sp. MMG025]
MNTPVVNPLPKAVIGLVLLMVLAEAYFAFGASGFSSDPRGAAWRATAVQDYGFYGQVVDDALRLGRFDFDRMVRFVSYPFIHYTFTSMLFAAVFVLAMGKFVGEQMRGAAVLVIFFGGSIMGALAYGLILDDTAPLIGGFPGAYALIGGFTYLLAARLTAEGENSARAFTLIGFLMGIQLLFALMFGTDNTWVADLTGFVAGFLLSSIVRPGGWSQIVRRLRRRA